MKKSIIALLLAVITLITSFSVPTACAATLTADQSIVVFHPDTEKTFAVGKDLFTFKDFTKVIGKDTSGDLSVVEITFPPQYSTGFLLEKYVTNIEIISTL